MVEVLQLGCVEGRWLHVSSVPWHALYGRLEFTATLGTGQHLLNLIFRLFLMSATRLFALLPLRSVL